MFERLRFFTAGESHGPKLTAILEGFPAGLKIDQDMINRDLTRRQQGFGRSGRMKIESDKISMSAGVLAGKSTGAPIAIEIANLDFKNWENKEIPPMNIPRPGHADLTGVLKYGYSDLRISLERASARETAMRVCIGALCKQLLNEFRIQIGGYVIQIGSISTVPPGLISKQQHQQYIANALQNEFAITDNSLVEIVREEIYDCMKAKDTLGGIFTAVALNVPPGLGSFMHWDRRLDAKIAMAMMSIPAMKGVEIGSAFANTQLRGTKVHDQIFLHSDGQIARNTNRAGGLEGGITTGEPIVVNVAMKPISTTLSPLKSVNLATGEQTETVYERSDFCAVPRAVPIGEAMLAFVLANSLMEKLGGDSLDEMRPRFSNLRRNFVEDINLDDKFWRFDYDLCPQKS